MAAQSGDAISPRPNALSLVNGVLSNLYLQSAVRYAPFHVSRIRLSLFACYLLVNQCLYLI
jgi:hypothetical protein